MKEEKTNKSINEANMEKECAEIMLKQIKESEEKNTETKPYLTAEEYAADVIMMFKSREGNHNNELDKIERRLKITTIKIPFEEHLRSYKLDKNEKLAVMKVLYESIVQDRGFDSKELFRYMYDNKFYDLCDAIKILSNNYSLMKKGCFSKRADSFKINESVQKSFFECFDMKKDAKKDNDPFGASKTNPAKLNAELSKYVIGQDEARQRLCSAVYEHSLRCRLAKKGKRMDKSNTLIIGPTGTGKTYICRMIAEILGVPFYAADASQFTEAGYAGLSADSILTGLKAKIPGMNNVFPPSIVYIDEVDKLCATQDKMKDIGGRSIQEELLKMLESDKYTVFAKKIFGEENQEYDISNIMFIAGGAFSGIEEIIRAKARGGKKTIGFGSFDKKDSEEAETEKQKSLTGSSQEITADDLKAYGFMPEFIGRFSSIVPLNPLSEDDLMKIMTESKDSALEQYREIYREAGIKLVMPETELRRIAAEAISKGTGARGIKNVLCAMLGKALYFCVSKGLKTYTAGA